MKRWTGLMVSVAVLVILAFTTILIVSQIPVVAANGLLHPVRHHADGPPPENCEGVTFNGLDITLKGWQCHAQTTRRGTIIYLHGVADNRVSSRGIVQRFTNRGFDVIAYDSRAHGESDGEACTYGFF